MSFALRSARFTDGRALDFSDGTDGLAPFAKLTPLATLALNGWARRTCVIAFPRCFRALLISIYLSRVSVDSITVAFCSW